MTGANKCLYGGGKESCQKHRMYAYPGEKAQFCSSHKKPGMVDVHNKRCEAESCQKHPTYGVANGRARFCTKHKGPNMVDVHCRPCEHQGCSKHPHYAFEGDKARFCASHKETGMVDVKHKRCHTAGCREMRVYETPTKKSRFCMIHLDEWLSAKTTRRAAAAAAQADNGPAKQRASTNGSSGADAGGNESRGRPHLSPTSHVALPPKREYQVKKTELDDKQDNRMMAPASLNAFLGSPSQGEDMPRGVKRRVPKPVPMPAASKARSPPPSASSRPLASSSGGFPGRSGGVISAGPPAKISPHRSVVDINDRLPKRSLSSPHVGGISVSLGMHVEDPRDVDEEMLLGSSEPRGRSRGGGFGGVVSGAGVAPVGSRQQQQQQAVLPPPLMAEDLHSLAPPVAAGGSAEPAERGGPAAPSYRRSGGNIGGVDGADGGGKRSRTMEAGNGGGGGGVRIGNEHVAPDGGGYSRGLLSRSDLAVYGQEQRQQHQQQHQQADRAGGSRGAGGGKDRGNGGREGFAAQQQQQQEHNHYQGRGGQDYSPKGNGFSSLSSGGIFPSSSVSSSSACSPGGGVPEGEGGGRRRGRPEDAFDMPSRREAGGGGGGAMVGPSYGYSEEGVAGAPLPPLSKDVNTSTAALPLKKGHRRHASFDPNTDCFSPHLSMGNGGISGPPGRGGVFPSIGGNDGHGYTGSVAGLGSGGSFGSSFGGNVGGGGSFGSSFTSNGRQHVRGCSSGSVDLNVLAPVLAEFRNGGGSGGGGAQQYPSLPPPRGNPHQDQPPPSHHAQQPTPSQSTSQHHEERHEQQRQHASYQSPAAAAGDSHHPHSAGTLPVVAEPGTPPHILSDDTASAPSPKKAISQAHQHPNAHHHGAHQHPNSRQHSAHDGGGDTELLHRHHQQHHSDQQGFRGDAGGRHREETFGHVSTARDYAQFYGEDHSPGDEQRQQHQRQRQHLPTSSGAVSVSGSPRWSGAKTPSSSLYAEAQGSASIDHLDSGRELHAGHVVGEGSTRIDGSRVDKGTIWIRHPEGMANGGRRSFTPH